jgi:flagellar biosynthesis protein FliR
VRGVVLPADLERNLIVLGWGATRSLPLVWLIPAFGGPTIPVQVRLALGLALSGICLPLLSAHTPDQPGLLWILVAVREVMVGFVMGFVCACWFRAAEAAGWLIDVFRGTGWGDQPSPVDGGRSSPMATLMLFLAVLIFLEIGGIRHVALALAQSYEAIPLGVRFGGAPHAMATAVILASAKLIESALGLCAPVMVSMLLADLVVGMLGRAVPQIPLFPLGAPLKALLAIGVMLLGLGGLVGAMKGGLAEFLNLVGTATGLIR